MGSANGPAPRPASEGSDRGAESSTAADRSTGGGGIPVFGGVLYGVLAVVAGWIGVVAVFFRRLPNEMSVDDFTAGEYLVEQFAWLFYNAHTVDITQSVPNQNGSAEPFNLLEWYQVGELWHFQAIPAVLLFVGGFLLARNRPTPKSGFRAGAAISYGYLPLVVGGAYFSEITEGSMSVGPEIQSAILIAGCAFPLVFGGLGGVVAGSR